MRVIFQRRYPLFNGAEPMIAITDVASEPVAQLTRRFTCYVFQRCQPAFRWRPACLHRPSWPTAAIRRRAVGVDLLQFRQPFASLLDRPLQLALPPGQGAIAQFRRRIRAMGAHAALT